MAPYGSERQRIIMAAERVGVTPAILRMYLVGERTPAPWVQRVLVEYGLEPTSARPFKRGGK